MRRMDGLAIQIQVYVLTGSPSGVTVSWGGQGATRLLLERKTKNFQYLIKTTLDKQYLSDNNCKLNNTL